MTNKTPPAWATKATQKILETIFNSQTDFQGTGWLDEVPKVLARHAPDAEALARALEECVHALDDADIRPDVAEHGTQAYRAYRAAHPKVTR